MATSNRPAHRPVRVSMAQMLFDRNNNSSTDTRHHLQSRPVAVPITPVFSSSRYSWQPGLLPIRAASPRQQPIPTGFVPGRLIYSWPFNPQETDLIRAGYKPEYKLSKADRNKSKMAEPRARVARHKGQMNFPSELRLLLLAYGDPSPHPSFPTEPLPETVRVLDEIVTDFILEMCHGAAQYATYSRRQKIKVDDFRFALRRDANKLGRVQELLRMERELKEARKAFDQNDDQVANLKDAGKKGLEDLGDDGDAATTSGRKNKGKNKRGARRDSDATEETISKKRRV